MDPHPQYRGCLTLEIANVSNTPVLLYPGRLICQLVLMHVAKEKGVRRAKRDASGRREDAKPDKSYFGPVYPEAPKFGDPQDDLLKIGVTSVSRLKKTQVDWEGGKWKEPERKVEEW